MPDQLTGLRSRVMAEPCQATATLSLAVCASVAVSSRKGLKLVVAEARSS